MRIGILVVAVLILGIIITLSPKSPFVADEAQVFGLNPPGSEAAVTIGKR